VCSSDLQPKGSNEFSYIFLHDIIVFVSYSFGFSVSPRFFEWIQVSTFFLFNNFLKLFFDCSPICQQRIHPKISQCIGSMASKGVQTKFLSAVTKIIAGQKSMQTSKSLVGYTAS
jgi:hypothetical protein